MSWLPELLAGVGRLAAVHGVRNVNFGHAGNGNIHVNLLIDPQDPQQLASGERCLDRLFDLADRSGYCRANMASARKNARLCRANWM